MQRELVVKAREGDVEAYSDLVRLAHPRLFNVARLILRDSDRAGDAVQDALLLAWRHVRSLRDPDAWDAWLHRLTVRACYKVAKKERRRREIEVNVDPEPAMAGVPDASKEPSMRYSSSLAVGSPAVRVLALLLATLLLSLVVAAAGVGASRLLAAEDDGSVVDAEPVFVWEMVDISSSAGFGVESSDPRATGLVTSPAADLFLWNGGGFQVAGIGYALGLSAGDDALDGLGMTLFSIGEVADLENPERWGYIYPIDAVTLAQ